MSAKPTELFGVLLCLTITLIALVCTVFQCVKTYSYFQTAKKTQGTIIGVEEDYWLVTTDESNTSRSKSFVLLLEFKTDKDEKVKFKSKPGSAQANDMVGRTREIYYDPSQPENAIVNNFWEIYSFIIFLSILSLVLISGTILLVGATNLNIGFLKQSINWGLFYIGIPGALFFLWGSANLVCSINQVTRGQRVVIKNTSFNYNNVSYFAPDSDFYNTNEVVFLADKPEEYRYYSFQGLWFKGIVLFVCGAIMLTVVFFFHYRN